MDIDIEKTAALAMLKIDDTEGIKKDLENIAHMAEILSDIGEDVPVHCAGKSVLREDVCRAEGDFIPENADLQGYIEVPAVLGGEN